MYNVLRRVAFSIQDEDYQIVVLNLSPSLSQLVICEVKKIIIVVQIRVFESVSFTTGKASEFSPPHLDFARLVSK